MDPIVVAIIAFVSVSAVGYFAFRRVVQRIVVAREQKRSTDEEIEQWSRKLAVLDSKAIVEFFAPSADFQKEWDAEKKKPSPAAWASPYRSAVNKLWSKRKNESPSKLALVRQQVASAADQIIIETLPEIEQPANAGTDHFSIEVPLDGRPASEVEALAPTFKSLLKLDRRDWSLTQVDPREPGMVRFVGHATEPADRLVAQKNGFDWFDQHPALSPYLLPVAVDDHGQCVNLRVGHTYVYGATAAGEGSVLSGILRQLAPYIKQGLVEIYAIDPNGAELEKFSSSTLLKAYTTDQKDSEELVTYFYNLMNARSAALVRNKENEYGDKHIVSKENPLSILLIDEMSSFLDSMQLNRTPRPALNDLNMIFSQGRKRGMFVIGAAQNARADTIPAKMRANVLNWVLLRIGPADKDFNDLFLGKEANLRGYDATNITPGPAALGMDEEDLDKLTAGIGFLRRASHNPVKLRFAHMTGSALRALADANPLPKGEVVPKVPTMTGKQKAAFETLSAQIASTEVNGPSLEVAPAVVEMESASSAHEARKARFSDEALSPAPGTAPRRSQVDENAKIRGWSDEKLKHHRNAIEVDPEKMSKSLWRGRLDTITQEQRIRAMDAKLRGPKPVINDELALPTID